MFSRLLIVGQKWIESGKWTWLLAPISWVWGAVVYVKNQLYDRKWFLGFNAGKTVVCVGNITAGGTGKTPFVHFLAKQFPGRKVAILSRMADEAALLSRRLPSISIYAGKNRASLARRAVEEGADLLILDDGFQHRKLQRDFDIVLLDGADPFGKGRFLPWGFLRDSPKRLERLAEAAQVFVRGEHFQLKVQRILDQNERPIHQIRGWEISVFCGIAKPHSFKKTLADLGVRTVSQWILADHQAADPKRLRDFAIRSKALGAKALICTEKDFVKLPAKFDIPLPILFLEMEMELLGEKNRWEKLIEKIDRKINNR